MSCQNCFYKLKLEDELYEIDGDLLCNICKEDLELWENNFLTYNGPKNNKFIVGKNYSYKLHTHDLDIVYKCIKKTKHYIHFKDEIQDETLKKKVNIDIWGNEFTFIDRHIMNS